MSSGLIISFTLLACTAGYFLAYRLYGRRRLLLSLLLIVLCGLALRLSMAADLHLHEWDERYHALVARNMMEHPLTPTLYEDPVLPYRLESWTNNHVWLHKQPVPLWAMALSMKLLGPSEIALRLPSVIVSTVSIVLTFLIGASLFNLRVGLLASFLHSVNGFIVEITAGRIATDSIDTFFLFFIELAVLLCILSARRGQQRWNILAGIVLGLAILTKWLTALIVLLVWGILTVSQRDIGWRHVLQSLAVFALFCLATFLPWQIYVFNAFPQEAAYESSYNLRHFHEVLEGHGGSLAYHLKKAGAMYGEMIYLPLAWLLCLVLRRRRDPRLLLLSAWIFVPLVFFSLARTKMPAYTLFAAPAVFLLLSLFWWYAYSLRKRFRYRWIANTILVLLIALPIRYTVERMKVFKPGERNPAWARQLRELKSKVKSDRAVIFNIDRPIEAMFYSRHTVYPQLPTPDEIADLDRRGYDVYIYEKRPLPRDIASLPSVHVFR